MEVLNNYAFTRQNLVGKACAPVQTPLVEGQTVKGDSVVCLCQPDSFVPRKDNSALVSRGSLDEAWQPVTNLKQLDEILQSTPKDQLGERLGEWRDCRHWLVFAADGKPGNNEVTPFSQRWGKESIIEGRHFSDLGFRPDDPNVAPYEATVGWDRTTATVVADGVKTLGASYPGKQVAVLEEPRSVSEHAVAYGLNYADGASSPDSFGFLNHSAAGVSTEPVARKGCSFPTTYVMPEPK